MKKRILLVVLALTLSLSLLACGADKTDDKVEDKTEDKIEDKTEDTLEDIIDNVTEGIEEEIVEDITEDKNEDKEEATTLGQAIFNVFKEEASKDDATAELIAVNILENEVIEFSGTTMAVEEGLLTGFNNAEITGFKEGVMFAPMIGSIPFVGYVFTLDDGADVEAFKTLLKDNADPRWNICTEADETVVENVGNKVFFLMCPKSFEE